MNKEITNHIVSNRIRTPDGTILVSNDRHDYRTYTDSNGKKYMVDGGNAYLRRTVHADAPYEELSVYSDDPHEEIRKVVTWGTYGKDGKQPLEYKVLEELSTNHIRSILQDCSHIPQWRRNIFEDELKYRNEDL